MFSSTPTESIFTRSMAKDLFLVTIGTALMAVGIILFIQPNKMAIGSVPGMAVPLHFMTGIPTGMLILLLNIPIFLIGIKSLGRTFGFRSIYAIVAFSLFTDFFGVIIGLPALTHDYILATLYGGTSCGIGLGLVLRAGSSTGGTSILAKIISDRFGIKLGVVLMGFDFAIILFGGIYFKNAQIVLWGVLFTYIMTQVIDYVLAGPPMGKIAYVISEEYSVINERITGKLRHSGMLIPRDGIHGTAERKILMVVLDNSEVVPFKNMVKQIDPAAFIIISNAYEVLGEGFPSQ